MTWRLASELVGEGGACMVEVRGQVAGGSALLPTVFVPGIELGLSGWAASPFTC